MSSAVVLEERDANLVRSLIESGRYASASDVVQRGLRLLEEQEREREEKIAALRLDIEAGLEGPAEPFDLAEFREMIADLEGRRTGRA